MAQKVSSFTPAGTLDGTEIVPVIQGGGNRRTTVQDIADKANAASIIDDAVPAFDKVYSSSKTKSLVDAEAAARAAADTTLQSNIDLKLNSADYNDRYKGKYTTLSALQTAHPTASAGDYAQVDAGTGSNVKNYNYDLEDGWVLGSSTGSGATNTDALPEGSTNLYFTTARAIAAVDISGKVDKVAGKQLSTEDYTTAEKTKLAGIAAGAQVNDANTTLQGNTFNGVSQLVKTDASGKLPAIDGSQLTNLPTGPSYTGTTNRISITAGVIDISSAYVGQNTITTLGTISTGTWQGTAIASGYGGTGFSSYAKGDLIFASDANILSKLPAGVEGKVLNITGGVPTWGNVPVAAGALLADGTIPLTDDWNAGEHTISVTRTGTTSNTYYDGFLLTNTTAGSSMYSPSITFSGTRTNSSAISFRLLTIGDNFAIQGTAGGSAWANMVSISAGATWTFSNGVIFNSSGGISGSSLSIGGGTVTCGRINAGNAITNTFGATGTTSDNLSMLTWTGAVNKTGGTSTVRGVYLNPTITGLTGTTLIGFQNEVGDNLFGTTSGSVGIGATTTIDASAILQITSTTKGFLPPRMTLTQWGSIATKAEGLQGWNNSDHGQMWFDGTRSIGFRYNGTKFQGYDGTNWLDLN